MNRQREAIYTDRRRILEGDDISDTVAQFLEQTIREVVESHTLGASEDFDLEALWTELKTIYPIGIEIAEVLQEVGARVNLTAEWLAEEILSDARLAYSRRTEEIGEELMRDLERRVMLSVIDRKWRDHLYEMDYLKEGIGLRAMAQRDPLVEYQREGFGMFQGMMAAIREESVTFLFNLEIKQAPELNPQPAQLMFSAPTEQGGVAVQSTDGEARGPAGRPAAARPAQAKAARPAAKPNPNQKKPPSGPGSSFFRG
jgi:preprotein translocase subunit SecA